MKCLVAQWVTKGKDFLSLYSEGDDYSYTGRSSGGSLGQFKCAEAAIAHMEANAVATLRIDRPSVRRL